MNVSSSRPNAQNVAGRTDRPVKSWWQQRREMLQLYARYMISPGYYRTYRFDELGKDYRYMLNFVSGFDQSFKLRRVLNDPSWKIVLDNKWLFYSHYRQFDIPMPEVYGIYDRQMGFRSSGQSLASPDDLRAFLQEVKPPALVAKPVGGIMGKEVLILNELRYEDDTITAVTNTGKELTFAELTKILDQRPNVRFYDAGYTLDLPAGYLLQEKIRQHEFLNELAPYTTNTIRVVTFLDRNNDVDIHFTILRLGRRGNMADNWDRGGISVAVDPQTGVLGTGVLKPKYGGQWLEVHPDSQVRFTGRTIPCWQEILALCIRAAKVTPRVHSIGWDVALTPQGPVLIEGNPDWDLPMVQIHTHGLLQPDVRRKLAEFGLEFPEGELPPVNWRNWWVRLKEQYRHAAFTAPGLRPKGRRMIWIYIGDFKEFIGWR